MLLIASLASQLGGCANGIPTESNIGILYTVRASACRAGDGMPNDTCVKQDRDRCVAMIDMANPARDETTYMTLTEALSTIGGGVLGYAWAGIKGTSLLNTGKALTGQVGGSAIGTEIGYYPALYRSTIDACMSAFSSDLKLTEQYFAVVKYDGKVTRFEDALQKVRGEMSARRQQQLEQQ
jgi:hypothetical protein